MMEATSTTPFDSLEALADNWQRQQAANKADYELSTTFRPAKLRNPREEIVKLISLVADLCSAVFSQTSGAELQDVPQLESPNEDVKIAMATLLLSLVQMSMCCQINMRKAILTKINLNAKKYPVECCKGKSDKYTNYSDKTGITKTHGQCTIEESPSPSPSRSVHSVSSMSDITHVTQMRAFEEDQQQDSASDDDEDCADKTTTWSDNYYSESNKDTYSVEGMARILAKFASERDWIQFHKPRNICLALLGELGELAECFQWRSDAMCKDGCKFETDVEKDRVQQELADCTIYLIRLATQCNVDLGKMCLLLYCEEK